MDRAFNRIECYMENAYLRMRKYSECVWHVSELGQFVGMKEH